MSTPVGNLLQDAGPEDSVRSSSVQMLFCPHHSK